MLFGTRPREATRPLPPIDSLDHEHIETATFAVG
jgi:hypothetical protein